MIPYTLTGSFKCGAKCIVFEQPVVYGFSINAHLSGHRTLAVPEGEKLCSVNFIRRKAVAAVWYGLVHRSFKNPVEGRTARVKPGKIEETELASDLSIGK